MRFLPPHTIAVLTLAFLAGCDAPPDTPAGLRNACTDCAVAHADPTCCPALCADLPYETKGCAALCVESIGGPDVPCNSTGDKVVIPASGPSYYCKAQQSCAGPGSICYNPKTNGQVDCDLCVPGGGLGLCYVVDPGGCTLCVDEYGLEIEGGCDGCLDTPCNLQS